MQDDAQDNDVVAVRQPDGHYRIYRYRESDGALLVIQGHEDLYSTQEMETRLAVLRADGIDTWVQDTPTGMHLLQGSTLNR